LREVLVQPRAVEQVAPRALGRGGVEERFGKHARQQRWHDAIRHAQRPLSSYAWPVSGGAPGVEQGVAGATIETQQVGTVWRIQNREVGDATDVENRRDARALPNQAA